MTRLRKSICALIALCMLLGTIQLVPAASAKSGLYEDEVSLLISLGIMQGAAGGMLNLEKEVTRAEFAALICRTMNLDTYGTEKRYQDVSRSYWAAGEIQAVSDMGYMNGDPSGFFRPEDTITAEEALKVLVSMLGYAVRAEAEGGYPGGYLSTARKIGILSGIELPYDEVLTRREIAYLIYNCLEINLMQRISYGDESEYTIKEGNTILADCLNVVKARGRVSATHEVNLYADYQVSEGDVVLEGVLYHAGRTEIEQEIGSSVTIYARRDKTDTVQTILYYRVLDDQRRVTVSHKDISDSTTETQFVYDEGRRSPTIVAIPTDVTVVYNGEKKFTFNGGTLKPETGDVTLITDGGKLTLIRIWSYQSRVVDSVSEGYQTIYYTNNQQPTKLEGDDVRYTIIKRDQEIGLDELMAKDVVSVAQSESGNTVRMIVSNETAGGTITEMIDGKLSIDGQAFPVSPNYDDNAAALTLGTEGTFYLDAFGEIVHAELGETAYEYIYYSALSYTSNLEETLLLRILNGQGKLEEARVSSKASLTVIDGNLVSPETMVDGEKIEAEYEDLVIKGIGRITDMLSETGKQLLKVKRNAAGEIRELIIAKNNTGGKTFDSARFSKDMEKEEVRYKDRMFANASSLYCATDETPVLVVSLDSDGSLNEKESKLSTVKSSFTADTKYSNITLYDLDEETAIPRIIVKMVSRGGNDVSEEGTACVVDEFFETVGTDGTRMKGLKYYKGGQPYEVAIDDEAVSTHTDESTDSKNVPDAYKNVKLEELQRGDVIQFSANSEGYLSVFRPLFVQSISTVHGTLVTGGGSGYLEYPTFETFYGTVKKRNSQLITFSLPNTTYRFTCTSPKVYLYNKDRNRIEVLTPSDLQSYLEQYDAFIHVSRKACQTIVIYDSDK